MIEVLVSLLVICVGVLGMLALQWRSIQYTQDTTLRENAMMLADNLLELMRSNPDAALASDLFSTASPYYKPFDQDFSTSTVSDCMSRDRSAGGDTVAQQDISCWVAQVKALLPVTDDMLNSDFAVCPTTSGTTCSGADQSVVMIRVAWPDRSEQCENNICFYTLRTEL